MSQSNLPKFNSASLRAQEIPLSLPRLGSGGSELDMYSNYWLPLFKSGQFTGRALPLPNTASANVGYRLGGSESYLPVFAVASTPSALSKEIRNLTAPFNPSFPACQLKLSGRLNGVSKARSMSWRTGALRPQAITSKIGYYNRQIFTKWGTIGLSISVSL